MRSVGDKTYRQKHKIGRLKRILSRKQNSTMINTSCEGSFIWATNGEVPFKHV